MVWTWQPAIIHEKRQHLEESQADSHPDYIWLGAACLQNETSPEKLLNGYGKRFEKREEKIRKTIRNVFEKISPSQAA